MINTVNLKLSVGASRQQPSQWDIENIGMYMTTFRSIHRIIHVQDLALLKHISCVAFADLQTIIIACIAIGFVILVIIAGTVIALKCRENSNHKPPSTILLQEEQYRMNKGPLPPIPENSSHYRSLIRQPGAQACPPHSQTMPRPQPQVVQACDDYSADYEWKFGTAPWNKPKA